MSTVMDDLGTDVMIIENYNLIVKLDKRREVCLRMLPPGIEGVILVDRFN